MGAMGGSCVGEALALESGLSFPAFLDCFFHDLHVQAMK